MKSARLKFRIFPLVALLAVSIAAGPATLGQGLPKADPERVGLSSERLDALMNQHVKEKKIAGAVTLVARRGKVAHLGVYGMQDAGAGFSSRSSLLTSKKKWSGYLWRNCIRQAASSCKGVSGPWLIRRSWSEVTCTTRNQAATRLGAPPRTLTELPKSSAAIGKDADGSDEQPS